MAERTYGKPSESGSMGRTGGEKERESGGRTSQVETRGELKCNECGQSFESQSKLQEHNRSAHE